MPTLLTKSEVARRLGYHEKHLMKLVAAGQFPRPIRLGDKPTAHVRFVEEEVNDWVAARLAERDAAEVAA